MGRVTGLLKESSVVTQIVGLSSGTLATLTGIKNLSDIDYLLDNWVTFAKGGLDDSKDWKGSWHNFITKLNQLGADIKIGKQGKVNGKKLLSALDMIQKSKFGG